MKAFFCNPDRVAILHAVAAHWIGTPFQRGVAMPGVGVDCVRFAAEVLKECGQIQEYSFPEYTIDGGSHLGASLVRRWLESHPLFAPVDGAEAGDVLEFRVGRGVAHHVGVYGGTNRKIIWSSLGHDGVQVRTLRDPSWSKRLTGVWRPMEGLN